MNNLNLLLDVNENTYVISDNHWRHSNVCWFAPMRLELLAIHYPEMRQECDTLINYRKQYAGDVRVENEEITQLKKQLSPFHDDMMIDLWNDTVTNNDIVMVLGDFAFKNIDVVSPQLNGRKILLRGNHDRRNNKLYLENDWECVITDIAVVQHDRVFTSQTDHIFSNVFIKQIADKNVLFSHFPLTIEHPADVKRYSGCVNLYNTLFYQFDCDVNIHGHLHHFTAKDERCVNVSAEHLQLRPTQLKYVLK